VALDTLQPGTILFEEHLGLAHGTNQDFEQIFAHRHASHFNSLGWERVHLFRLRVRLRALSPLLRQRFIIVVMADPEPEKLLFPSQVCRL